MADLGLAHLFTVIELLIDDDLEVLLTENRKKCSLLAVSIEPREWMPKVQLYMANVIRLFDLPEHIDDFSTHFRVTRRLFEIILGDIYPYLTRTGSGPHVPVAPEKQLLVALCYIGNAQSMREVGHTFDLSKSTIHKTVLSVVGAILSLKDRIIKWPTPQEQVDIADEVQTACGLTGVVGFLDGTHIRLTSSLDGDRDYYNRKGFPSIQLQIVVDHRMVITSSYTGWPGCTHDARVLRNSCLFKRAEQGELYLQDHHILADNAYPLRNWLITPFKNFGNLTPQQIRFNKRLSSVRQTVERAFGHLKGRFRRLREVPLHDHSAICQMIIASCILHNICILNEDDVEAFVQADPHLNVNNYQNVFQNGRNGVARRLRLVNAM